ncbi:ligand-binding sensor domain-containing protein, partial [Rubrivirga sp.]|uniref:ligand-binding sensor domain-containing protein n=1 Tax=Rubrivirga sp. TaxID=1885344 RepID=UPI003C72B1FF
MRYGTEHGLPSDRTLNVAQDSSGFIWVGTADGIARFDGVRARVWRHQPRSTTGLPSSIIGGLAVAPNGTVWVGTDRGLAYFDEQAGRFVRFAEQATREMGEDISNILADSEGLWVAMPRGVGRIRYDGTTDKVDAVGFPQIGASALGEAWLYHERCLLRDRPVRCEAPRNAPQANFGIFATWKQNGVIFGLFPEGQVWRLRPSPSLVEDWPEIRGLPSTNRSTADLPRIWFATSGGPYVYDTERRRLLQIGIGNGVVSRDARDVLIDRQGGVWLATDRGLYRGIQPDPAFQAVTGASGLPDGRVNGLLTTPDGSTWIGTNGGLYQRRPDGTWTSFFTGKDVYANGVWQVTRAAGGGLWVGGKGFGLRRLWPETGRWEPVTDVARLLSLDGSAIGRIPVRHVLEADGRLWVSSSYGLAVRLEDGTWLGYKEGEGGRDGLPTSATNIVHVDGRGRVWIATDAGLVEFDVARRSFRRVATGTLGASIVWDISENPDDPGALWLATVGTGTCRLDPEADAVECFTITDGLPSNVVHRVEPGPGAMWLGTDRGIARFDLEDRTVATFTQADGLHGDIADFMSSYRTTDGRLLFGG